MATPTKAKRTATNSTKRKSTKLQAPSKSRNASKPQSAKASSQAKRATKPQPAKPGPRVRLVTSPSHIEERKGAWVVMLPRFRDPEGTHQHTYGQLTPYFRGLTEGRLLATKCVNPACPVARGDGELWLPPRADCPDCHLPMVWEEVKKPEGYIYTYTFVERGGEGLEIETPYYQIDVKLPGVATIVKSWLVNRDRPIHIGDRVRARFLAGKDATHTALDLSWELCD
jgi:uncharacterized OB-fold protein